MPAESKAQHGLMGLALSVKRGQTKLSEVPQRIRDKVARLSRTMSEKQLEEYTSTPTSGLPRHAGQRVRSA